MLQTVVLKKSMRVALVTALTWLALPLILLLRGWLRCTFMASDNIRSAVIAGVTESSLKLAEQLRRHPEFCTRMVTWPMPTVSTGSP